MVYILNFTFPIQELYFSSIPGMKNKNLHFSNFNANIYLPLPSKFEYHAKNKDAFKG